jgi:hypothetical protein
MSRVNSEDSAPETTGTTLAVPVISASYKVRQISIQETATYQMNPRASLRRCEQIDNILAEELESRKKVWETERTRLAQIVSETLLGAPANVSRIHQTAARLRIATENYRFALDEFTAFVVRGIFPDRLKVPGSRVI